MSTLKVTTIQDTAGGNSSTSEEIYNGRAKAWVNFNGTGTVAIRADFNVNTITDNATGDYTVNFDTALADANYSVSASNNFNSVAPTQPSSWSIVVIFGSRSSPFAQAPTTNGFRLVTVSVIDFFGTGNDCGHVMLSVFR